MEEILQKNWSGYRKYTIKENGLYFEVKTNEGFTARLIKFEEIGFDEIITKYQPGPYAVGLFLSVFFNILCLMIFLIDFAEKYNLSSGVSSGLTGGIVVLLSIWGKTIFKFEKQKILNGGVSIVFDYFKKKQEQVDQFINLLKVKQRAYIRAKYMQIDDYLPQENQKSTFLWLYDANYIDRQELQELLNRLDKKVIIKGF